jgi:glycosyltransferase involved in cell wall biosynthesis
MKPLSILHINSSDLGGGAGRVAYRLAYCQRELGNDAHLLVGRKTSHQAWAEGILASSAEFAFSQAVGRTIDKLGIQYLFYPYSTRILRHKWTRQAQVINLHNVHSGYMSRWILPQLAKNHTLVWTLHDMWTMTGHCATAAYHDCNRWQTGCGRCPDLQAVPSISWDTAGAQWRLKRALLGKMGRIVFVCPSKWMLQKAKESALLQRFPAYHIPNGVDTRIFRPLEKQAARNLLGIETSSPVLLVMNKGIPQLREVFGQLATRGVGDIAILDVGSGLGDSLTCYPFVRAVYDVGRIQNERMMALCYAAADLLVFPSMAENFPLVILESLACGTPVIAFDVGGIGEAISSGETGSLIPRGDTARFAIELLALLANQSIRDLMHEKARRLVNSEFSLKDQTRRYLELYQEHRARETDHE